MSLEVLDFTERKKIYKFEAGEFTLKPPYMNLVGQVEVLIRKLTDIGDSIELKVKESSTDLKELTDKILESKDFKKIADLQLKLLRLLLEETANGKLADLSAETLRQDVLEAVLQDFFSQFRK